MKTPLDFIQEYIATDLYKSRKYMIEDLLTLADEPKLMKWFEQSDFYVAPASAQFHLNELGGLAQHVIDVHLKLTQFFYISFMRTIEITFSMVMNIKDFKCRILLRQNT